MFEVLNKKCLVWQQGYLNRESFFLSFKTFFKHFSCIYIFSNKVKDTNIKIKINKEHIDQAYNML